MKKQGMKIKKGDTVVVIAGADKGAEGRVIAVQPERDRVVVEGVNLVKQHTKVLQQGGRAGNTGGIVTKEASIHVSNVALVDGGDAVRIGYERREVEKRRGDGTTYAASRSVRVNRKTGKEI